MKFTSRQIKIVLGLVVLFALGFYIFTSSLRSKTTPPPVELSVWGTDPSTNFDTVFQKYKELRPNVTVAYKRVDAEDYNEDLLDALASGKGPDVFMISSEDLTKQQSKLAAAGATQMDIVTYQELFPTVAEQDFVRDGQIYALPLYIDDLALIYNRDLLDAAGIVSPPLTWEAFQMFVVRLRALNEAGQITMAGAALGGSSRSVLNAEDIIYALMLQKGTTMTSADFSNATFADSAGTEAFDFYLRFSNAASSYYTWNDAQLLSTDAFAAGKVAMIFGYRDDVESIKRRAPFLNVATAQLPQLSTDQTKRVTFASYQGLAVSKQAKEPSWAWDFVVAATTNKDGMKGYASSAKRSPALRSLIAESLQDPDNGVFARQALIARSWHQPDSAKVAAIFDEAIKSVLQGTLDAGRALRQANEKVDQLLKP